MKQSVIDYESKLNDMQRQHRILLREKLELVAEYKKTYKVMEKARKAMQNKTEEIRMLGQRIFSTKHAGETPHVTDHAIVRYLERVEGVDIWDLKSKVAENANAVRDGNVIVTINMKLGEDE